MFPPVIFAPVVFAPAVFPEPGRAGVVTATVTAHAKVYAKSVNNVIALLGSGTSWLSSAPTFSVSGGSGAAITAQAIADDTHAVITVTAGTSPGSLTITDSSTGATTTVTVARRSSFAPRHYA